MTAIFTVGHSNHSIEAFLKLLKDNKISAIADVRSAPFSKFNPQFNQGPLKAALKKSKIAYVFLGNELGARSDDPRHYDGNRVVYGRLAASPSFRAGIARIEKGLKSHRIAMMCAEKDPITCHRTILVSRELDKMGFEILHIQSDGSIETHDQSIERLMGSLGINSNDLFIDRARLEEEAYWEQELRIAYVRNEEIDK